MTAEPKRDPLAKETSGTSPEAPTGESAGAPPPSTATDPQTAAAETPATDAAAEAPLAGAPAADAAVAGTADAALAATADAAPAGAADAPAAAEAPAVAAESPAVAKPSRRPAILAGLRRLVFVTLAVVLFVGGVALGNAIFQRTRPAPLGADAISFAESPPPVAQEFITALGANDADAMRSSLNAQPNKDLTDEFERFDIKRITSVEILGTSVDGTRSATEILMRAVKNDGLPFEVNLVILVDSGQIEGFR